MFIIISLIDHYLAYNLYSLLIIIIVGMFSYFFVLLFIGDELVMEGLHDLIKMKNKLHKKE